MGTPSSTAIVPKDNHVAVVANANASLVEDQSALKVAKNECVILETRIKVAKQDRLKTLFAWLAGGFGVLALLSAIGAWYLSGLRKKLIQAVMLSGASACACGVLIKLVPYFGAISIWTIVAMVIGASWYLSKHTDSIHARICKARK
jgi:hypothetical protein